MNIGLCVFWYSKMTYTNAEKNHKNILQVTCCIALYMHNDFQYRLHSRTVTDYNVDSDD